MLLAHASLAASRTLSQWLLACLNFSLDSEDLYFWYKQKKVISMNYDSSTSSWKPWRWMRLDLIFSVRDIYINSNLNRLTKFTSSSRSTKSKDILPWNISQMITNTIPNRSRIVISYVMKQGIPLWIWWKVNGNWDINMIKIFQLKESICRTNTSIRTRSGIQVVKLTIWVRLFQIEILHQIYQFYQNR